MKVYRRIEEVWDRLKYEIAEVWVGLNYRECKSLGMD
jgi:hypothetical protein